MIYSREQARRTTMGWRIRNPAEEYKFRPFYDWDDEKIQRWIVQWEVKKGNCIPTWFETLAKSM